MVVMVNFPSICEICAAKYSSAVSLHFPIGVLYCVAFVQGRKSDGTL